MKSNITLALVSLIVLVGGAYFFSQRLSTNPGNQTPAPEITPTYNTATTDSPVQIASRYVPYSKAAFDATPDKKRVLFFHAPWCPTCRPADAAFQKNELQIPSDVMLFKTDYDSSTELKKQYAVTYQHTFVLVDSIGKEVKKWNGGDVQDLISNTK